MTGDYEIHLNRRQDTPKEAGGLWAAFLVSRTVLLGWTSCALLIGGVATLTLVIRAHLLSLAMFSASGAKVAAGEIWLLPASALVVDRPVYVGFLTFALLGFAALWICGTRVFWVAAVMGHIGSTVAVYSIIAAARLTDPDAFGSAFARQDFGVSAIQGAWVGAIAATAWGRARADPHTQLFVVSGVLALAGVAWWLHPDPSILTTEHLFAFLIGCGVVSWPCLAAAARAATGGAIAPSQRGAATTD